MAKSSEGQTGSANTRISSVACLLLLKSYIQFVFRLGENSTTRIRIIIFVCVLGEIYFCRLFHCLHIKYADFTTLAEHDIGFSIIRKGYFTRS